MERYAIKKIAEIHTGFREKFGIPRQSGMAEELKGTIIFEPEYRNMDAVKGLEEFSHIWLLFLFSQNVTEHVPLTIRPPKLGGKEKKGVFATRSPYRPNFIGMSCVRLESVEDSKQGPLLHVAGVDLLDGTPIIDIKPYVPFADAYPDAQYSYANGRDKRLEVSVAKEVEQSVPEEIIRLIEMDPRPGYRTDEEGREYGLSYEGYNVRFRVKGNMATIVSVERNAQE